MFNKTYLPKAVTTPATETKEESFVKKQKVQPPVSNRTLYHPSFMSLYTNPGVRQCCGDNQTVHPMTPQEFYYTDPTMRCGTRIPNHVQELKEFDCFQLNTPPPIMSACPAPENRPDPFRTVQYLTRNLGSPCSETGTLLLPRKRMWMVVQLTQEEDQAITNMLTLHHGNDTSLTQDPKYSHTLTHYPDQTKELSFGKHWSDAELEVANTLLTQFGEDSDVNLYCGNLLPSSNSNVHDFAKSSVYERVLSESEGDALCGLLNLGLTQS